MIKPSKIAVLIVDNDPNIRELIQLFLQMKNENISCAIASDPQQAVLKMSNQVFDIFLIDNIVAGRSGLDFALSLKKSIKYSKTPIILMSSALDQNDVMKAISGGIKDILIKPFSLRQFSDKIGVYLKKLN
jgi:DNA-binding response OmpR family regulator